MTFTIDKFFIEEFNKNYGTELTYQEFKSFYDATRQKKKDLGLVKEMRVFPRRVDIWEVLPVPKQ